MNKPTVEFSLSVLSLDRTQIQQFCRVKVMINHLLVLLARAKMTVGSFTLVRNYP